MVAPKFQGFSEQYTKATFIKVDVDEASDIAQKAGIRAMPTFQIFVKGEKVEEVVGASIAKLEEAIKKYAL